MHSRTWAARPRARLAAFTLTSDNPGAREARSSSALGVASVTADRSTCVRLLGRRDASPPEGAQRVHGHRGDLYLGARNSGYRVGYRTFADSVGGTPTVLQIAVASTVPTHSLLAILNSVKLIPESR